MSGEWTDTTLQSKLLDVNEVNAYRGLPESRARSPYLGGADGAQNQARTAPHA